MRKRTRNTLLLVGTSMAVASLPAARPALASDLILNPAELKGQASFGAEAISQVGATAYTTTGVQAAHGTFPSNQYSLTVESGQSYQPWLEAYFSNPTAWSSSLQVRRWTPVLVDNQVGPTTVDFHYPGAARINYSISVLGGVLRSYDVYGSASGNNESYYGRNYNSFSAPRPSSTASWVAMIPQSSVSLSGWAYVTTSGGTDITRNLTTQTLNMLQGQTSVNWAIDLTTTGMLAGSNALTTSTPIQQQRLYFRGVSGTAAQGISGSPVIPTNGSYALEFTAGQYDVFVQTQFSSPAHRSETKSFRVTIDAGQTTTQDFVETLGTGEVPLVVNGFFTNADLSSSSAQLRRQDPSPSYQGSTEHWTPVDGQFDFALPSGDWRRYRASVNFYDNSNPQIPLNAQYHRYHYTDSSVQTVTVDPGMTADLGAEELTLVESVAYFDVKEASAEAPEILLKSPNVSGHGYDYDENNSLKTYKYFYANGSSQLQGKSALVMVAEPGTYTMNAYATVNGNQTLFSSKSITFGAPVNTPTGTDVVVTPVDTPELEAVLKFDSVSAPGYTSVVVTPLGPQPPANFGLHCPEKDTLEEQQIECTGVYYDIRTTASFQPAAVEVCVRQKFAAVQALSEFLVLGHYNETTNAWEVLEPPPDKPRVVDCIAEPEVCGCDVDDLLGSCGITGNLDVLESVFMLCGMTTSFSPFTVLRGNFKFTNEVNGISFQGPNGPPSLQTWTAPGDATYRITAVGARGAAAAQASVPGGCGAQMSGEFALKAGDTLQMLVGQKGLSSPYSGGGGGGTFVTLNGAPLLVAGGGGGVRSGALVHGRHGSVGPNGVAGSTHASYLSGFIAGGTNGMGGARALTHGSAGGGWFGNGASDGTYGEGGLAFVSTPKGGRGGFGKSCGGPAHGGYGGGGAGNGCYGGGGGGGYAGGGGGRVAGGGGSWNVGANPENEEGVCTPSGHGVIVIEYAKP